MPEVRYLGEPDGTRDTTQYGYVFEDGKPVDVTDAQHLAKFRGNRFFEVNEKAPQEGVGSSGLKAIHIAGGRFVIKRGDDVIKQGLNKADADAFNALSDEDKVEYVKD